MLAGVDDVHRAFSDLLTTLSMSHCRCCLEYGKF